MKTKFKKSPLFILSVLPLLLLSSCGEKEVIPEGKTKITFYARHFEEWSDDFTKDIVKEFNKDPNCDVYVDLKIYDADTYNDALVISRENGNCPDVFMNSYSSLPQDAREDNALPLNDMFDQSAWDDLNQNILDFVTFKDKIYGFPWFSEPGSIFFYRKDVLAKYGYTTAPKTFDELYAACEKIKAGLDIGQYALGLPANPSDLAWTTWGLQQNLTGGLAVSEDWMTSRIEEPGYKELCRFFNTCAKKGYSNTTSITSDGYSNLVESLFYNNTMMSWGGSWQIALLFTLAEEDGDYSMIDKIGISQIPTLTGETGVCTATNGGWCYTISTLSSKPKQEAAAKFIKWLFVDNPDKLGDYFIRSKMSREPASKKVADYLKTVDTGVNPEWIPIVNEISEHAIAEAAYPWDISYEVSNLIQTCVEENGDFDLVYRTALQTAIENINTLMSRRSYKPNPWYEG